MFFEKDGKRFVVTIAGRPLVLGGEPSKAKIDRRRAIFWISDQVPRHERRIELFHELRHWWIDDNGRPNDDEADATSAAEMMDTIFEQYFQQGGDAVLESLNPLPDAKIHSQPSGPMARTQVQCGYCEATTCVGSIAASSPAWNSDTGSWTIERGILCEACDRVTVWRESCTAEGMPLGMIVPYPPPRMLHGVEAGEWIAVHHETCRITVKS